MDTETRKRVLRKLTYGLYIVTAQTGDEVAAAAISWLSQASFTPPLVMLAVKSDSHLHALLERTGALAVNIVDEPHKELAAAFFRPSKLEQGRINGYSVEKGQETGSPLIVDLPAWFEARVTDSVTVGDHTVYVAQIVSAGLRNPGAEPLVLGETEWSYAG